MRVSFLDEYDVELFTLGNEDGFPPIPGDIVIIDGEEWKVKSRIFYPKFGRINIILSQGSIKVTEKDETNGRLTQLNNAIVDVSKRLDKEEKKRRLLSEELVTVRTILKGKNGNG